MRVLTIGRREGSADYFPLASLVGETIPDAEIYWQEFGDVRLILLFRARLRHGLVAPARAPDFAPHCERLPELDSDDGPLLRTPAGVQHHAQDAVDAEPGVPEAGVGSRSHFIMPNISAEL